MTRVIGKLLAGNKEFAGYLTGCAVMAAFWLMRVLFHSLSTVQSHKVTFAVLGSMQTGTSEACADAAGRRAGARFRRAEEYTR